MWFLIKSSTSNKGLNNGDIIIDVKKVEVLDLVYEPEINCYKLIFNTHKGRIMSSHDTLEKAKESMLEFMNLVDSEYTRNESIVKSFDPESGRGTYEKDILKQKGVMKEVIEGLLS